MLTTLCAIWLLHVAALVTPGANVLLVTQLAASDRSRSALFAALGVTVGAAMWSGAAVLGVNAIFEAFPRFRISLQIAGAIYLLYLATRLWRSPRVQNTNGARTTSASAAFRLGLLTNATNPKSALFFGSIFSASFPARPSPLLLWTAVVMVVLNALCWHALLAFLFSRRRVRSVYASKQRLLNRLAGGVAGSLGLGLLVTSVRDAKRELAA
jgi:threonine/homoserine/homoserine lactone efflux protein